MPAIELIRQSRQRLTIGPMSYCGCVVTALTAGIV
jgi:hypothetical protein